ncbi:tetratricopeptide repeat domain-containingprotein [Purpureocillium lavendulum]|uniref:Tetratricopeptide repeat domain-containingprotein n=1 Tax=Purpureocillium lavendulum TaxID=1247861 RepID=A0AB34FGE2_9HYPO|nr:tetratricopeptide repeat domain-containingprotein [Purpureocillium lavendulum]
MTSEQDIQELQSRAAALADQGRWAESSGLLEQAVELWDRDRGADSEQAAECRSILAYNYRHQGRYQQARELDSVVLTKRSELLGNDHPDTAKSLNNLALDLKGLGHAADALGLEHQALAIISRVDGEDAPSTLTSVHNLANSYANVGRHRDAARLHERVVHTRTRVLGEDHFETIMAMDLLGVDYRNMDELDMALTWQQKAVNLAKAHLGELHDTTIKCTINMATTCRVSGRPVQAIELLEATYRACQASGREDTPLVIGLINGLAVAYCKAGRLGEAKPLLERCYDFNNRVLGANHPTTGISRDSLEWILEQLGELQRAQIS